MTTASGFITACQPLPLASFAGLCVECRFDQSRYHDGLFAQLGVAFPEPLRRAVSKRKAEFLAGRYAAQRAMRAMGLPATEIPVGRHRSPLWPAGIRGSISHSGTRAYALISTTAPAVGIDFESCLSGDMAANIKSTVINRAEEVRCGKGPLSFAEQLTLIFSAKESLFKTLYPSVQRYFEFLDAEVVNIDPRRRQIALRLLKNLTSEVGVRQRFICRYTAVGTGFLTYMALNE